MLVGVMSYRHPSETLGAARTDATDTDLLLPALVLWLASVALVVLRLAAGEPIEGESALAAVCTVALPLAFVRVKKV